MACRENDPWRDDRSRAAEEAASRFFALDVREPGKFADRRRPASNDGSVSSRGMAAPASLPGGRRGWPSEGRNNSDNCKGGGGELSLHLFLFDFRPLDLSPKNRERPISTSPEQDASRSGGASGGTGDGAGRTRIFDTTPVAQDVPHSRQHPCRRRCGQGPQ